MRLTCSLCKKYLLPISPLYTLTSEFIFSTLFSMHFLWLTTRVCLLIKSFLPSTVNWRFLRIFLVAKIYFNSVKTNNRPHSVAMLNAISSPGDLTFFKIPGFFFQNREAPGYKILIHERQRMHVWKLRGLWLLILLKFVFYLRRSDELCFFLIIIS